MSSSVIKVHRKHLEKHQFTRQYETGFEYLHNEVDFSSSEIAEAYRDIDTKHMYRVHTDQPRQFLILQKNPNLKSTWVSDSAHGPHIHLSNWEGDSLVRNIAHSRTTVSNYLANTGGLRLKIILQSIADIFTEVDFGFDSALDQKEFQNYLLTDKGAAYSNDDESPIIESNEGFFGDFAYTNAMKYQAPANKVRFANDDKKWLKDELAAISPRIILALGNGAKNAIKTLGFERTEYDGPFTNDEGKIYRYNGSDSRLQGMYALRLYHLGARNRIPHEIVHESLRAIKSLTD